MKENHIVLGVHLTDRFSEAHKVQDVFTMFGKNIKTRIGIHDVHNTDSGPEGVILLDIYGGEKAADDLAKELSKIMGVETKKLIFTH